MSEWNRPRALALAILEDVEGKGARAEDALDRALTQRPDLDPRDAGLVTELVYGTLRHRGTIDHLLTAHMDRPVTKLERRVLLVLRMTAHQLYWLDRVPASAAIDEGVKLLGKDRRRRGFANAVLRALDRDRRDLLFGEIADWTERMSARHSHPRWLVERWEHEWGREETEALLAADNTPARVVLRANLLKTNREELLGLLARMGVETVEGALSPEAIVLPNGGDPRKLSPWKLGLSDVQDEASQLIAPLLNPSPDHRVLDLCAGPGGKATAIAERMGGRGRVVALDVSERKCRAIAERAARLGIGTIHAQAADGTALPEEIRGARFDAALVDAPCSGLGTLQHNPERRWRFDPTEIPRLVALQDALLRSAAAALRPDGTLLYSVCTIGEEETTGVVRRFLEERGDFAAERAEAHLPESARELIGEDGFLRAFPHRHGTDGLFAARLVRRG